MQTSKRFFVVVIGAMLAGCAIGPNFQSAPVTAQPRWSAALPHGGEVVALADWWNGWGDATLTALIEQAQRENTSVAAAAARITQARATVRAQTGVLLPSFDAKASDIHSKGGAQFDPGAAPGQTQHSRSQSLDAAWEFDLVGGARRARQASTARATARYAEWHDARVSIAAEVATQYVNLRTCELLLTGYDADARSRAESARLTETKAAAGFEAPANAALSRASAAEAAARLIQQRGECRVLVKVLAELTALPEPALVTRLAVSTAVLPQPKTFAVRAVPAEALSQRPDLAGAEGELAASMAEIGVAMADRFPRLSLTGTIGYTDILGGSAGSNGGSGRSWSYGPALSLPIFDFGRRAANVDLARARYDESLALYRGRVQRAVREVEESLVRLESAGQREADANAALAGYRKFLTAAEARVRVGAGSLTELEEARRAVVAAEGVSLGVARERLTAWIALYKAVGGGWANDTANDVAHHVANDKASSSTSGKTNGETNGKTNGKANGKTNEQWARN